MKFRAVTAFLWCVSAWSQSFPAGASRQVFERVCGECHPANVVTGMGNTREGWKDLVNEMFLRGGRATSREKADIVNYLARNFPLPARKDESGPSRPEH